MDANPQVRHALSDPAVLRQSLGDFTIGGQEFRFGTLTSYVAKAGVSIGFGSPKPL